MIKAFKRHMRWVLNLYPPFLGAGIRVRRLQSDWKAIDVEMNLRFWNANYVGTHFGGSLYSMTDPFYMLMLIENLGRDLHHMGQECRPSVSENPAKARCARNFA